MENVNSSLPGANGQQDNLAVDAALNTLLAVLVYVVAKVSIDRLQQWRARIRILIVGAGPVGLAAALVAVKSRKVLKLTVIDLRARATLLCRPQQIALDPRSVRFLLPLGVDFDNIEGCWHNDHFYTKVGVFQEHLLSILEQKKQNMDIHILLGTKFTDEYLRTIQASEQPKVIVVADGSCGESSFMLGISSDYLVESCNAYGANAALERPDQRQVPTPEIRAHSLDFDLSAYGVAVTPASKESSSTPQSALRSGFHLKIYGTFRNRYMALACPASDSRVVRFLRHTTNSSIMKNVFHQSFNAYKADIEPRVNDMVLHHLQCSRRLFEVLLSHRKTTVAYIEEDNIVVTIEGEAARVLNFDTGCGVNLALRGLESSEEFFYKVATAVDQGDIFQALAKKIKHSKQVAEEFLHTGLLDALFT